MDRPGTRAGTVTSVLSLALGLGALAVILTILDQ
jgi:hypothetical protein